MNITIPAVMNLSLGWSTAVCLHSLKVEINAPILA